MKLRRRYKAKRLTRELQEIGFVAEDQVVVGNEVEEPDVELLRIVALQANHRRNVCQAEESERLIGREKARRALTFARRRSRITLMPVDASSLLGML